MIKLMTGIFSSIFILASMAIIYYWRDIQYDPSSMDLIAYFILLPTVLSLILLSPYLIYQAYQYQKKRKETQQARLQQQKSDHIEREKNNVKTKTDAIQWLTLNIFSSFAVSALGENETIIEQMKKFSSPELDVHLINAYGLPVLSYRITAIDDDLQQSQYDDDIDLDHARIPRIKALIQQQLEQQTEILWQLAEHLKKSALFYDVELAYQYRIHPAWVTSDDQKGDQNEDFEPQVEQVSRLNCLNIHVLLADNLLHMWDESSSRELLLQFMQSLGIISQQIQIKYHFIAQQNSYQDWLNLLGQIATQPHEVSLVINVDSEIDQAWLDEQMWLTEYYLAAEFASSCCVTAQDVKINHLEVMKILKVALNADDLSSFFHQMIPSHTEQIEQTNPFVLLLDDATDIKVIKKTTQVFSQISVDTHHFLYPKQSFGHTQSLVKIFGFMLGVHLPEELTAMVYSADHASTYAFFQADIK
ncbi:hypothetical protein B9T25_07315 [Acinetobacter sp. ANC 4470]|uniref:hypothetical protein n=1 Tax=Acinetobacter sp. ANC 4470 TaxID=1977881 RepID=UPI000A335B59|nr:hypothetical protein [Acinetobacter sp. ANC 4470]OTG67790.1 hypothetical protein B9T25_07315 [Acinetobacter sp. ANC 4470]